VTNSLLRSALKRVLVLSAAAVAGCGEPDGREELKDGWAAYGVHDLKKADRLFDKSVGHDADNVDALVASAQVKLELGELDGAKAMLGKAAALAGDDDDVVLLGARLAYFAKDYKAAAETYSRFAADAARAAELRADAYVDLAVVEIARNAHEAARIALMKALLLDRRNAAARYHLGWLYRDCGYAEAALEQFETYVMLERVAGPRAQRVQRQIIPGLKDAIARKAMGRPGADKRDSAAASAALQKADAEMKKGNLKTARFRYADALKADPLSYPAALGLAQMWEKTDRTPEGKRKALECYQTACGLKPGAIRTLLTTGRLAAAIGQVGVATEAYSRTLAADPKNLDAIDGMIGSLRRSGGSGAKTAAQWQGYRDLVAPPRKRK